MGLLLREMIQKNVDPMFDHDDRELEFFYRDHKEQLLSGCSTKYLTPDDMAKYEHRPRRYLYENHLPQESDWILCWLNDLSGPEEFKNLSKILVPNYSALEDLYNTYRTLRTQTRIAKEQLNDAS